MTKKTALIIGSVIGILIIIAIGIWLGVRATVGSVSIPRTADRPVAAADMVEGFEMPEGWSMGVYAQGLKGARVMLFDQKARMLVSQPSEGKISIVTDANGDGVGEDVRTLVSGLSGPHGMAFQCGEASCDLYVAERDKLSKFSYDSERGSVSNQKKLLDFEYSASDRHKTRTLLFLPSPNENTLLISVGSTCNVCEEEGNQAGKILAYDTKTGNVREYSKGLRNAVFMATNPVTGMTFVTEMGRDGLGDDTPPDEINILKEGSNYGWPICYGKNVHDTGFDKKTYIRNPCMEPFETPSLVDIPAHSAPLGLSFVPEEGWPEDMWNDLLVAYHGSWNRSVPTGFKIVRMDFSKGVYQSTEDFITGWLTPGGEKIGRPVDVMALPGGTVYISDDAAGVIYHAILTR